MMKNEHRYFKVAPGVWGMKILFVNVYAVTSDSHWILIDAGLAGSAGRIKRMADDLFDGTPPSAILLTHGHFDHRGALASLLTTWDVLVYAHKLELPYLTGRSAYPPPDPTAGGGLMSLFSFLYPKQPIDLGKRIQPLPDDDSVPLLSGWKAILVPGHAPGQVAFYRPADGLLIAGDAFVTTKQESAIAAITALPVLSGPPKYFTYDWNEAKASVIRLQKLQPRTAATGHGLPMYGEKLRDGLKHLVDNFNEFARPKHGRYVDKPAVTDARGVIHVPPISLKPVIVVFAGAVAVVVLLRLKFGR